MIHTSLGIRISRVNEFIEDETVPLRRSDDVSPCDNSFFELDVIRLEHCKFRGRNFLLVVQNTFVDYLYNDEEYVKVTMQNCTSKNGLCYLTWRLVDEQLQWYEKNVLNSYLSERFS